MVNGLEFPNYLSPLNDNLQSGFLFTKYVNITCNEAGGLLRYQYSRQIFGLIKISKLGYQIYHEVLFTSTVTTQEIGTQFSSLG